MDSLALPFCANAVWFMIRPACIYKAANIWALTGKDIHQLSVFWLYNKKSRTVSLFLGWFHLRFVPEVRKYLSHKALSFKDLLILDNVLSHPGPHEFSTTGAEVVYLLPNTVSEVQIPDQGLLGALKLITHGTLWKWLSMLWKRTLMETTLWVWKDYTTKDAIVIVKKPAKPIKPETISSCGRNCFQMLCVTSQNLWQSQSRKSWKRLWIWQKKIGWWLWRVSEYGSWRHSRANRHYTRGITRRWLSASEPVSDNGEDVQEAVPEKQKQKQKH